ncbi:unnamed protein product [Phytomonas sp. EM1]|nr:unnamed protein product [Phytomonas sp. EM1]|eukprot:CCW65057.1 unnamed protein product [Phytomonas sp. isolate EM1]
MENDPQFLVCDEENLDESKASAVKHRIGVGSEPALPVHLEEGFGALRALQKRLIEQNQGINSTFRALIPQVESAIALSSVKMTPNAAASLGSTILGAYLNTLRAMKNLFIFLFESVYVHQLESSFEFLEKVEQLLQFLDRENQVQPNESKHEQQPLPSSSTDPYLKLSKVAHSTIRSLRWLPLHVHRQQGHSLKDFIPLYSPGAKATMEASEGRGTTGASSTLSTRLVVPRAQLGAGPSHPSNSFKVIFAISSAYLAPDREEILHILTDRLHATAVVLPKMARDMEEAMAILIGCLFLVTPLPRAENSRIYCIRKEQVEEYTQVPPRRKGGSDASALWQHSSKSRAVEAHSDVALGIDDNGLDEADAELNSLLSKLDEMPTLGFDPMGFLSTIQGTPQSHQTQLMCGDGATAPPVPGSVTLVSRRELQESANPPRIFIGGSRKRTSARADSAKGTVVIERASALTHTAPCEDETRLGSTLEEPALPGAEAMLTPERSPPLESQFIQYKHRAEDYSYHDHAHAMLEAQERDLLQSRPPHEWLFQIGSSCKELRRDLVADIERLGSQVDSGTPYNPRTTHLVVLEGITERTEKYLCACAAGIFIVPPRYVFDSSRRGHWLLGRMGEYDINPRHSKGNVGVTPPPLRRPFASWRVLLLTSQSFVASGISAVLRAGGCTHMHSFVFDGGDRACGAGGARLPSERPEGDSTRREEKPHSADLSVCGVTKGLCASSQLGEELLGQCSHILVECETVSETSTTDHFDLPVWFPTQLRCPAYYPLVFTLELLYHCLCVNPGDLFDADGAVVNEALISDACRLEPFS